MVCFLKICPLLRNVRTMYMCKYVYMYVALFTYALKEDLNM